LTGDGAGSAIELRNHKLGSADHVVLMRRQYWQSRHARVTVGLPGVEEPVHALMLIIGTREIPPSAVTWFSVAARGTLGLWPEAFSCTMDGKSDAA